MLQYYLKIIELFESFLNFIIVFINLPRNIFKRVNFKALKNGQCIHILGNGPSLKDDISTILNELSESDSVMVVNTFAITSLYEKIKPNYYTIVDPAFFMTKNIPSNIIKVQENVTKAIREKTVWNMTLIVPNTAKKNIQFKKICQNKNVTIKYFKGTTVLGGKEKLNCFYFKYNLANPLFQNVLIASIFFSLKMRFKRIFLWGADHSWHTEYILGKDNIIYTPDKHFYSANEIKYHPHLRTDGKPVRVHEEFANLSRTFRTYHSLQLYANSVNCNVINKSSITWIDAFSRRKE
jgi:hypothetical protein